MTISPSATPECVFSPRQYDKALEATQEALRRNPGSRIWNGNLVSSYLALQRLPEAKAAAESARARQLDSPWLHICLYLIAYEQADSQEMAREAAQLKSTAEFEDIMLYYQAQAAAREGRLNESRSLSDRAVEMTLHAKQPDSASLYLAQAAMNDAWAGNRNEARGRLKRLCSFHRDAKEKPSQPWPWRLQATRPRPCAWPTTSPIAFRKTPWCAINMFP